MATKQELINQVSKSNQEFRTLMEEHQALEVQLEEFNKRRYLTPEQEVERKIIQKKKLHKKDRMAQILRQYQS